MTQISDDELVGVIASYLPSPHGIFLAQDGPSVDLEQMDPTARDEWRELTKELRKLFSTPPTELMSLEDRIKSLETLIEETTGAVSVDELKRALLELMVLYLQALQAERID